MDFMRVCREQTTLSLYSAEDWHPQIYLFLWYKPSSFCCSSTADRPRGTFSNFSSVHDPVCQVGFLYDRLSCDVSVKHLQCCVWKAHLIFPWLQSSTTCGLFLRSSGCSIQSIISKLTDLLQQIQNHVRKGLPTNIWIRPSEEIT